MNRDGSEQTRITFHEGFDWPMGWSRADGRILAFGTNGGNFDVYTLNPDGTDIRYLTADAGDDEQPAYSPDGAEIIYINSTETTSRLMVMNSDGSNKRVVADTESEGVVFDQPAFSADGTQIGYSLGNRGAEEITRYWRTVIIADRDGSNKRILRGAIRD